MTTARIRLKQNAAAMLAYADGKPVQSRYISDANFPWEDNPNPGFYLNTHEYRPKPEPVSRPWNSPADVPVGVCYLRLIIRPENWAFVLSANSSGPSISGRSPFSADESEVGMFRIRWDQLNQFEHSTDRITWKKCEVTEEPK